MTTIEWDKAGERIYQLGLDRGVLFIDDVGVPWNGLVSVEDTVTTELNSYYIDGVRFLNTVAPGDYSGKLTAFTYPDEFEQAIGIKSIDGLSYHDQPPKSFNLTYRTKIGNDVDGINHGYKLHLLYNLVAIPESSTFQTINNDVEPNQFSWGLTGLPQRVSGYRPTAHISIDSNDTSEGLLTIIEDLLYGTSESEPYFPTIIEVTSIFGSFGGLIIVDNGNGTWTAIDEADHYITMLGSTEFRIDFADATYLDSDTYEISSTNL